MRVSGESPPDRETITDRQARDSVLAHTYLCSSVRAIE
nr:MAG TPA: hypothetical protein [Caudoviricetes sp.]